MMEQRNKIQQGGGASEITKPYSAVGAARRGSQPPQAHHQESE